MEFEKLVSPSLKDLFITHIEAMILSGELPVGQQLPPERQLAQSMGVSRAVVNSGVAELERHGLRAAAIDAVLAAWQKNGQLGR